MAFDDKGTCFILITEKSQAYGFEFSELIVSPFYESLIDSVKSRIRRFFPRLEIGRLIAGRMTETEDHFLYKDEYGATWKLVKTHEPDMPFIISLVERE